MEFLKNEWMGKWDNFEDYIDSMDSYMILVWEEAEAAARSLPMFRDGVKQFWRSACRTVTEKNPYRLAGWEISESPEGIAVKWLGPEEKILGVYEYSIEDIIQIGLEGKPNFLFHAKNTGENCPFRFLMSMEPMPARRMHAEGGYLSHLHFQFAERKEELVTEEGKLIKPYWYATMCAGEGTLLDRCNIIRGLHHLAAWEKLPALCTNNQIHHSKA